MSNDPPAARAWCAVPLVMLAGCVDGIGWLTLDQLFISFISGTSTMLGVSLAAGDAMRAAALGLVVALFAAGALLGFAVGRATSERWRTPAVLATVTTLLGGAALLAAADPARPTGLLPAIAFAMVPAMGALNTALPGVGGITFVTGAMTRFAEALVAAAAGRGRHGAWALQLALWAALVAGAATGGLLETRLGAEAVLAPTLAAAVATTVTGLVAWRRPA